MTSSTDQGNNQTKVGSSWSHADKDQSSALQNFTRTKKVGTTHIFPDNLKNSSGVGNKSVDGSSCSSDVVAVSTR
jgi:hypothetical protein